MTTTGRDVGEVDRCWFKGTQLKLCRMNKTRDLMHSMRTRVNNTVLNTGNLLKDISGALTTKKYEQEKRKR